MDRIVITVVILTTFSSVIADIYLHNPRGSNNRLDGNGRARANDDRLFDSQNNARGGYNVGNVYYYVNSLLGIEWTNQHSCADQNNNCEAIIQYMCSPYLRDGVSTNTIPDDPSKCENDDCNSDIEYGMHEDFYYYSHCTLRTRNTGLFTSDKKLDGESAKYTRQNPQGKRRGYECPEERDYYPYWQPTPWRDIAVLTNDVSRCEYYRANSENVKSRWACEVPTEYLEKNINENQDDYIPISKEKCEAFEVQLEDGSINPGVWKEYPSHGLPAPECLNSIPSRDNHLGNTLGGNPPTFNWTVIDTPHERCALRIRYNISTADYDGWNTTSAMNNRVEKDGPGPDIWTRLDLSESEAGERGYYLKQNPQVDVFKTYERASSFALQLAINTAQLGRTFEDRSHKFAIRAVDDLTPKKIHNLNVRGKRGNIVQVYPAVEYDFVPNTLRLALQDAVHVQFTGSNDNPNGNDGQGRAGTDRSNIVLLSSRTFSEGNPTKAQSYTFGHAGVNYPANISLNFAGLSNLTKFKMATTQIGGVLDELDDAGTYFDLGPRKITMAGDYNYMCTRNNNFSNRSQKGKIVARDSHVSYEYIGEQGGTISSTGSGDSEIYVEIPPAALTSPQVVNLEVLPKNALESDPPNTQYISDFVHLSQNTKTSSGSPMVMSIPLHDDANIGSLHQAVVYRTVDDMTWINIAIDEKSSSSNVQFQTDSGGYFVVTKSIAPGPLAGLIIGCVVAVILIGGIVFYFRSTKLPFAGYSSKV